MKKLAAVILFGALAASAAFGEETKGLTTQKDKLSYSVGIDMGNSLKRNSIEIDPDMLLKGIKDAMTGEKTLMTEQEIRETIQTAQKEFQAKQQEKMKAVGEKNKKEGETFLAENKIKEGIKTLPSGLQYKVISAGSGTMPKATDTVTVNYKGMLIDGTEFDSSYKRGEPATFAVNGVIKGWTEALLLMKEGAKWQLFIPSDLAYGERGAMGGPIGPNAVLIFDVELVKIKK
jgi:FKBP-type peptidyl-prolyl cis-trans isomerase FklB